MTVPSCQQTQKRWFNRPIETRRESCNCCQTRKNQVQCKLRLVFVSASDWLKTWYAFSDWLTRVARHFCPANYKLLLTFNWKRLKAAPWLTFIGFRRQAQKASRSLLESAAFPALSNQQDLLFYAKSVSQRPGKAGYWLCFILLSCNWPQAA